MNHAQLRAFHAVAENGGFSAAAKALGLTQPAITLQVQALEQRYNAKLFIRRGRHTEITSSGQMLLSLSKRIFSLEKEAHILLSSLEKLEAGALKISASSSLVSLPILSKFQEKYPAINLSFSVAAPAQLEANILDYQIDIAFQEHPPTNTRLFTSKLYDEPLKLAVSTKHPWAARTSVAASELQDLRVIFPFSNDIKQQQPSHWANHITFDKEKIMKLENKELGREAVANNLGVSLFTERETNSDRRIQLIDIEGKSLKAAVYMACLKEKIESRIIASFFETAESE